MNFIRFLITIKDLPHHHLKRKSLITVTVLISLISPLQLAAAVKDSTATLAQAQTQQNSKAQADKLFQLGVQQYRKGQLQQAASSFLDKTRQPWSKCPHRSTSLCPVLSGLGHKDRLKE